MIKANSVIKEFYDKTIHVTYLALGLYHVTEEVRRISSRVY
jgi:hypothetical protein